MQVVYVIINANDLQFFNLKLTKKRQQILNLFEKSKAFSAHEIHTKLKDLDLATVYRNLNLFVEAGLIKEIRIDKDKVLYERIQDDHQHAKCIDCGDIRHFSVDKLALLKALDLDKFEIDQVDVIVRGRCC